MSNVNKKVFSKLAKEKRRENVINDKFLDKLHVKYHDKQSKQDIEKISVPEVMFGNPSIQKMNGVVADATKLSCFFENAELDYESTFTTQMQCKPIRRNTIIRYQRHKRCSSFSKKNFIKKNMELIHYYPINQERIKQMEKTERSRIIYKRMSEKTGRIGTEKGARMETRVGTRTLTRAVTRAGTRVGTSSGTRTGT